jgi:natural product precursor
MKLEKIKLRDIVDEKLTNEELGLVKGGFYAWGCGFRVCSSGTNIDTKTQYCTGNDGICSSGIQ